MILSLFSDGKFYYKIEGLGEGAGFGNTTNEGIFTCTQIIFAHLMFEFLYHIMMSKAALLMLSLTIGFAYNAKE